MTYVNKIHFTELTYYQTRMIVEWLMRTQNYTELFVIYDKEKRCVNFNEVDFTTGYFAVTVDGDRITVWPKRNPGSDIFTGEWLCFNDFEDLFADESKPIQGIVKIPY